MQLCLTLSYTSNWRGLWIDFLEEEDYVGRKDCTNIGWPEVQPGTQEERFKLKIHT